MLTGSRWVGVKAVGRVGSVGRVGRVGVVGGVALAGVLLVSACKEPMADDPGYKAGVTCNNKMKARADKGEGTRNDSKATCIAMVGDRLRADAKADVSALADCILAAADEAAAKQCK